MEDNVETRRHIRVLPDEIVDQIAAGEVVERPASVVKELVENALDAGATHIHVEVEHGGKQCIRVLDNGMGMTADEARLALRRHATSKLRALDDLFALATMGFRGEALPSIAAVSRMTLTSRTRDQMAGTRLDIEAGSVVGCTEVGAPIGTHIEIRDLLYNVPARLKFLKGNATEAAHVTDVITKLAMVHPHIHMRLRHGSRVAVDVPIHPNGLERARALLGKRLGRNLHPAVGEESGIRVEAYLAAPEIAQSTARSVHLFAGRRSVKDRGLLHAIHMGYGELIPRGRYPVAVLRVEVPRADVDINVHPQKLEVRFSDPAAVYAAVRHVVRRGVAEAPWLADDPAEASSPVRMRALPEASPPPSGTASPMAVTHAAETARALLPHGRAQGRAEPALRQGPEPGAAAPTATAAGAGRSAAAGSRKRSAKPALSETLFPLAPRMPDWEADHAPPAQRTWSASLTSRAAEPRTRDWPKVASDAAPEPARDDSAPAPAPSKPAQPAPAQSATAQPAAAQPAPAQPAAAAPNQARAGSAQFFSRLHYLGQLHCMYLICEADGELVLVDQHAAHERVAFERLRERYRKRAVPVQRLLFPRSVDLTPAQGAVVEDCGQALADMGFELEPFGGASYAVKAVPAGVPQAGAEEVLLALLDDLADRGGSRAVEERLDLALATIACHSVVRAGDTLSEQEVKALFQSLDEVDFKAHCPHGRPVLLRISVSEIGRRFGRT